MSGMCVLVTKLFVGLELGRHDVEKRLYHPNCVFSLEKPSFNLVDFEIFNLTTRQLSTLKQLTRMSLVTGMSEPSNYYSFMCLHNTVHCTSHLVQTQKLSTILCTLA